MVDSSSLIMLLLGFLGVGEGVIGYANVFILVLKKYKVFLSLNVVSVLAKSPYCITLNLRTARPDQTVNLRLIKSGNKTSLGGALTGFIQESISKIQGLFKDFYKSLQQLSRT